MTVAKKQLPRLKANRSATGPKSAAFGHRDLGKF